MEPLIYATIATAVVGAAYLLASVENANGHFWTGLACGILAMCGLGMTELNLLETEIGVAAFSVGVPVSIWIALQLGFSISEIISPSLASLERT